VFLRKLSFSRLYLQFQNNPVALLEWFAASVAIVVVVTLIYVYVLNKSPPPEGEMTVSKVEQKSTQVAELVLDPGSLLMKAEAALKSDRFREAVEFSAQVVSLCLTKLIQNNLADSSQVLGSQPLATGIGISDMAYLVQSRAKSSPRFAEQVYQLSNLRLMAIQDQTVDQERAIWAFSFANWLYQIIESGQIKF
jgi:hypothetical protein